MMIWLSIQSYHVCVSALRQAHKRSAPPPAPMAAPNLRPSAISVINGVKSALVNASRRKPRSLPSHQRPELSIEENLFLRHRHLAPALKAHYTGSEGGPLKLINGRGQYLYDSNHDQYLDLVNNVCHVGHCHPRVVTA